MLRLLSTSIIFACLAWSANPASAHLYSVSYSTIEIATDEIRVEMRHPLICVLELFPIDQDGDQYLTDEEIEPAIQAIYYYLTNKIKVLSAGRQLSMRMTDVYFEVGEEESYLIYDLRFERVEPDRPFILFNNIQEEVDPYHRNIALVVVDGREYLFVFTNANYFDSRDRSALTPLRSTAPRVREPSDLLQAAPPDISVATKTVEDSP